MSEDRPFGSPELLAYLEAHKNDPTEADLFWAEMRRQGRVFVPRKRRRGRGRPPGPVVLPTEASLRQRYREHQRGLGRSLTEDEFCKAEGISRKTLDRRLNLWDCRWPPE